MVYQKKGPGVFFILCSFRMEATPRGRMYECCAAREFIGS